MLQFLLALNIVFSIICCIFYLLVGADPKIFWLFSIASLLIPVLFVLNISICLFWLVVNWKFTFLSLVTILAGWSHLRLMIGINEPDKDFKCKKTEFTIMSYNIYGLKNLKDTSSFSQEQNKKQFTSFVRTKDPDIFCVQEVNFYADDIINKTGMFQYSHFMINFGAAIYSKFPILDKGFLSFGTRTNSCLWADVLVEGKTIRIYSVHLQSNKITKDVEKISDEKEEVNTEKLNIIKKILHRYRSMSIVRARQSEMIHEHTQQSDFPVILAGDFNDTPFSYVYKVFSTQFKDSFIERGNGLGSTYVGLLPGLRIDYILADSKNVSFCSHRVFQTTFSDHNPIVSKLYIRH
ncbi:MAG: endonuclease/exonuclease/phosphatase family protein [Bacteroidota bacterium]|nr:endonuclease/exonuclease/phosphatase family protein [Bacteroidota bacterium]